MERATPFLKWPGGKTKLLPQLERYFPSELKKGTIHTFVEPFVGGGSMLFYILSKYQVKEAIINDINKELILVYQVVKKDCPSLLVQLKKIQDEYYQLNGRERGDYYYQTRQKFNDSGKSFPYNTYNRKWISRAAETIFLNKTCYNGLFRLNKKGEFNTPHGRYKNPRIHDPGNLHLAARALEKTKIILGDFTAVGPRVNENTFVYFDPPYRPLNATSNFVSYSANGFEDAEQKKLAMFFSSLHEKGAKLLLSNSEPKNEDPGDAFFEQLYKGFYIDNVYAYRMINSKGHKRGRIKEIVVTNYKVNS